MNKRGQKRIFWEACVLALFFFGLGVTLGFFIESSRAEKVNVMYLNAESELLDVRVQSQMFDMSLINCNNSIAENVKFADKVYEEAEALTRYENAQRLSESLILQHKKYDLLRALVWMNSIKIKKDCNADYHNIIYFYQYDNTNIDKKAEQTAFSQLLREMKDKYDDKVLLLPIAGDIGGLSIQALRKAYNITVLPTILIDEKIKITELDDVEFLEKYL